MAIKTLMTEDSTRPPGKMNLREADPDWERIRAAILEMDGENRSVVQLFPSNDGEVFMAVGGGEKGLCCCFVVDEDGNEVALVDPSETADTPVRFLLGEISTKPRNEMVPVESALRAARWYFDHGNPSPEVTWRRY